MVRQAQCCCGKTSISVSGEPAINGLCHCGDCRRRTGSAFGWSAYFRDGQILEKRGETRAYRVTGDHPQVRYFCARCGSTLYWKTEAMGDMTGVAGGSFTAVPLPEPTLSLHSDRSCGWLQLPESWEYR